MTTCRGGFIGSRIIEALLQRGERVQVYDISPSSKWASDSRVSYVCGDMTDEVALSAACRDIDTVYMTAALINFMDSLDYQYARSHQVNVCGAETVINVCQALKVKHLIYTSSAHVTLNKNNKGINRLHESDEYVTASTSTSHYALTKSIAEQLVRNANNPSFLTVCVRPLSIYGAYDRYNIQAMTRDKHHDFLGTHMISDWLSVDDVAYGHLLAESKLRSHSGEVAGEVFSLSSGTAVDDDTLRTMIIYYAGDIKAAAAPVRLVWLLAYVVELLQRILRHRFPVLPPPLCYLTPTALRIMRMDTVIESKKAEEILGFRPVFTFEEGIQLAVKETKDPTCNVYYRNVIK